MASRRGGMRPLGLGATIMAMLATFASVVSASVHLRGPDRLAQHKGEVALSFQLLHISERMGIPFKSEEYNTLRVLSSRLRTASSTSTGFPVASGVPYLLYYIIVSLGTPPVQYALLFDTGSDILWVQCECQAYGCIQDIGYTASTPNTPLAVYDPLKSSTSQASCYSNSNPSSTSCTVVPHKQQTCPYGACPFSIAYGDGSFSIGTLFVDVFQLPMTGKTTLKGSVTFGCAQEIDASTQQTLGVDGLVGMQFYPSSRSIFYQMYKSGLIAGVMAFCFDGVNARGSKVRIGAGNTPANMQTTPLLFTSSYSPFVNVTSITVGSKTVSGTVHLGALCYSSSCASTGGVLVDTGTSITQLSNTAYNSLVSLLGGPKVFNVNNPYGLDCTKAKLSTFPNITIRFPTTTWNVPPSTYMIKILLQNGASYCLGVEGNANIQQTLGPNAILGESWIENTFIQMDFVKKVFGFAPQNCTTSTLF